MFDIGFFEIIIVGIVSLIVLGPERLPGTIRTVSLWIGRLRRSFNSIKTDIEKEIGADDIRRQLRNEEIMEKFRHTQSKVQNSIQSIKNETEEFKKNIDLESQVASFTKGQTENKEPSSSAATSEPSTAASTTSSNPQPSTNSNNAEQSKS